MAIFGRRSARRRLRNATRESLAIPAFSAPVDCSAWVLGGLWPAELTTITPETAPLAEYLNADLQRIANSANEKLHAIGRSGLAGQARQAAEARVINVARAFAVLRVESTVRQLHKEAIEFRTEFASLNAAPAPVEPTEQIPVEAERPRPAEPPLEAGEQRPRPARHRMTEPVVVELPPEPPSVPPAVPPPMPPTPPSAPPAEVTGVAEVADRVDPLIVGLAEVPQNLTEVIPAAPEPEPEPEPPPEPAPEPDPAPSPASAAPAVTESSEQRLQRLLAFVARQEPGLRWAIGTLADGRTLLTTDIAHGWIPSGIELPAEVQLLRPGRRTGTATAMLGSPTESAAYSPGDRLGWASDFGPTDASVQPRGLANIEDLGWQLSEATHWRDGLPRMANTLAKAGAAGTGVADAEIDLLRVHLDTLRYQLFAQYPDSGDALVLNCMLLAATEGIATGDLVSANYHFSWFRTLSAPQVSQWDSQS